ncbi:MAG: hypothetical protein ABIQ12_09190 [Opitutaceae bacterium]
MPDSLPSSAKFELKITSTALPAADPRWRTHVEGLLADLKRQGGEVRRELTPVAGTKGGIETIILALGSSGAIAGAVTALRAWLARSKDGEIAFKGEIDGKKVEFTLSGKNVTEATLQQILKGAFK